MTLSAGLIINFIVACLLIFVLWLILTNIPPLAGYRNWVNIGCLILVVLALIAIISGKRAIDIGMLDSPKLATFQKERS